MKKSRYNFINSLHSCTLSSIVESKELDYAKCCEDERPVSFIQREPQTREGKQTNKNSEKKRK
jgi:hypothetical protein